jgi:hypothetical protein
LRQHRLDSAVCATSSTSAALTLNHANRPRKHEPLALRAPTAARFTDCSHESAFLGSAQAHAFGVPHVSHRGTIVAFVAKSAYWQQEVQ